jgi:hypothetical protein
MDKIAKLRLKAKLAEDSGDHQKAYNIRKKIKGLIAKAEYKEAKGPSGVSKIIKKVKAKGAELVDKVNFNSDDDDAPKEKKVKKVKKVKVKKEKKPKTNTTNTTTSSTSTSVSGTYGLAYGTNGEKGVGSVTYNGKTYKPGDQGYETAKGVFMETINQKEAAEKRIQEIKKKKNK